MKRTRDRLVTATNELFRRHGYHGTSIKQVTAAADAPIGSLYHFFPGGKVELAEAVIRETGAVYLELFELIAATADGPGEAVAAFFDGAADTLVESGFIDVCPIGGVAREVASSDERLRAAAAAVFRSWVGALSARLVAGGVPTGEATALAGTVVAALEGGFVLARTARDADLLRRAGADMRALVDKTIDVGGGRRARRPPVTR